MYSDEERMRAVELYIKLGKRLQARIRELGYPTKNALKGWYGEYERRQDLPMRSMPRPPKFSAAQKQMALEHCQPGALHFLDAACLRLSWPGHADCLGARGISRNQSDYGRWPCPRPWTSL